MSDLQRTSKRILPLAILSSLAFAGCIELARSSRVGNLCTPEAARSAAEADARAGAPARDSYAEICGVAKDSLNRMYAEAYAAVPEAERGKQGFLKRLLP
jgi:hypothetical protein